MRVNLCPATFVLLVALAPSVAAAQGNTTGADTREVLAYRLTLPKLKQLNAALADLSRQRESDPAAQQLARKKKELEALSAKDELTEAEQARIEQLEREIEEAEDPDAGDDSAQSLTAMAGRMQADPRTAAALKRAGLAAREAATLQLSFLQTALAAELLASGTIREIPKDVNADNVSFYQAHKAEIAAMTALSGQSRK